MIVTALDAVAYRVHDPKWSFAPMSGAGAGKFGGRANRPGVDALYLSLDLETAINEYRQLDALLPPALIVSYLVDVDAVVDFRAGYTDRWDAIWKDFFCDWRKLCFSNEIEPPSWVIGDRVFAGGAKGILFNSTITGRSNLVLYTKALTGTDLIKVHDPDHALPRDQSSWEWEQV